MDSSGLDSVRLVIWDLDGVFWDGVLSEGGITYNETNAAIVRTLAERGIVSAICSKNDFAAAQQSLEDHDIWRYFIFPSIDWAPKGQRIAALIGAVQLRPENILFIDDNPMNLAEAAHYAPGLQTAGHDILPSLLSDARFAGREDPSLSRLAHYRLLEQRHAASRRSVDDNHEFLRQSGIQLTIDYDIEPHIDRAIELINRTNQLNFTKRRLPEDIALARAELRKLTASHPYFSGLVKLTDRFGDHGYIGFFCVGGRARKNWLIHFCFSCRVLNMGIERWIYRWLDRPALKISGDVACNPRRENDEVDWISLTGDRSQQLVAPSARPLRRLVIRGGCEATALSHYFSHVADELIVEAMAMRNKRMVRIDNSSFLNLILDGVSEPQQTALIDIGYSPEDWSSALTRPCQPGEKIAWVISFWCEDDLQLYAHKSLGFKVPFCGERGGGENLLALPENALGAALTHDDNRRAFAALKDGFTDGGRTTEADLQTVLSKVVHAAGNRVTILLLLAPEQGVTRGGGRIERPRQAEVNRWIRAAVSAHPGIHIVDSGAFLNPDLARDSVNHLDPLTYYRIAQRIIDLVAQEVAQPA